MPAGHLLCNKIQKPPETVQGVPWEGTHLPWLRVDAVGDLVATALCIHLGCSCPTPGQWLGLRAMVDGLSSVGLWWPLPLTTMDSQEEGRKSHVDSEDKRTSFLPCWEKWWSRLYGGCNRAKDSHLPPLFSKDTEKTWRMEPPGMRLSTLHEVWPLRFLNTFHVLNVNQPMVCPWPWCPCWPVRLPPPNPLSFRKGTKVLLAPPTQRAILAPCGPEVAQ